MSVEDRKVDRRQLVALVRAYLRMGSRGLTHGRAIGSLAAIAGVYCLLGLLISGLALHSRNAGVFPFALQILVMTFLITLLGVVVEAGTILFDINEAEVLQHRPISAATLLAAKTGALYIFGLVLAVSMNAFPCFVGLAIEGAKWWFPLAHLASVFSTVAFCCALVVCAQGLALRLTRNEGFDEWIVWSQVGMMLFFQIGIRAIPSGWLESSSDPGRAPLWLFALPPAWFAGLDAVLSGSSAEARTLWLAGTGVAATILLTGFALPRLAGGFDRAIVHSREARSGSERGGSGRPGFLDPVLRTWMRDPIERASFRLVGVYLRRDRDLRLALYPSLAYVLVMPAMLLFQEPGEQIGLVMLACFLPALPAIALGALSYSTNPDAADLFSVSPLASATPLFHGARKAVLARLVLPAVVLGTVIALALSVPFEKLFLCLPSVICIPTLTLMLAESGWRPFALQQRRGSRSSKLQFEGFVGVLVGAAVTAIGFGAQSFGVLWLFLALELSGLILLHRHLLASMSRRRMPYREE